VTEGGEMIGWLRRQADAFNVGILYRNAYNEAMADSDWATAIVRTRSPSCRFGYIGALQKIALEWADEKK